LPDFLGFNVRRYRAKLLIKPSPAAVRRLRNRLGAEMRTLRGSNATAVIATLNPIIRGWAAYYRGVVSSRIFSALDTYLWRLTYKWAKISHRNKSKKWVTARYFGKFNKFRNDHWVFGDRDSGAPDPVLLDADRPAPDRPGQGFTRRSHPDRLLGCTAQTGQTPTGRLHPAPTR
jgi:hypothetical protein